jgi:hypothetical protein
MAFSTLLFLIKILVLLSFSKGTTGIENVFKIPPTPDGFMSTVHIKTFADTKRSLSNVVKIMDSNKGVVLWTIWYENASVIVQPVIGFREEYTINILVQDFVNGKVPEVIVYAVQNAILFSKFTYMSPKNSIMIILAVGNSYYIPDNVFHLPVQLFFHPLFLEETIFPSYVFIPNANLAKSYEHLVKLGRGFDIFDGLGIHRRITMKSDKFTIHADHVLPYGDSLLCLKSSWERMHNWDSGAVGFVRCGYNDYLLLTFEGVLNISIPSANSEVINNPALYKVGRILLERYFDSFESNTNLVLIPISEITVEIFYCKESNRRGRYEYSLFVVAFEPLTWGLLLALSAAASVVSYSQQIVRIRDVKCSMSKFKIFLQNCFEVFCVIMEQGIAGKRLALIGYSLTTVILLNVYRTEIFSLMVLNPGPRIIPSLPELFQSGFKVQWPALSVAESSRTELFNQAEGMIIRNLRNPGFRKHFEKNPEKYLGIFTLDFTLKNLEAIIKKNPTNAFVLVGAKSIQNYYVNNLKLGLSSDKLCSTMQNPVERTWHFGEFLNPLHSLLKRLVVSLDGNGLNNYWRELEDHRNTIATHQNNRRRIGKNSGCEDEDVFINIRHIYPVLIICGILMTGCTVIFILEIFMFWYIGLKSTVQIVMLSLIRVFCN